MNDELPEGEDLVYTAETTRQHTVSVIPVKADPHISPRIVDDKPLLQGLWIERIDGKFGRLAQNRPLDHNIVPMQHAIVIDYPDYVRGLLTRLRAEKVDIPADLNPDENDGLSYIEHPLELRVEEEDIRKLVMTAFILAGASTFVVDRPVLGQIINEDGVFVPKFARWDNYRHVWQQPHIAMDTPTGWPDHHIFPKIEISDVKHFCELLEPYFRAFRWHSGRFAVALGAFLSYALSPDSGQGYLALTTVFEALLSTEKIEITHQISERVAFLLETEEEARFNLYKKMKALYNTRSRLVHGDIENVRGVIKYNRLRLDAKMTIVPDQDYADLFAISIRLFKSVLLKPDLLALLEKRDSTKPLNDYYLRLGFRQPSYIDEPS